MTTGHAPSDSGEPTEPGTNSAPELPTFDVIPMRAEVRRAIDEMGWSNPTPVQIQAYPLAINGRDILVIQGITVFIAAMFVIINTIVDLLYAVLDPRIRRK